MRAAVLSDYSSPPRPGEFEDPVATDGAEVVEVSVAGLNPVDLYTAAGLMPPSKPPLPSVPGREAVGTLDGRRVYFDSPVAPFGSIAERALVASESVIDVPDGVADELAVCFGIAGLAAWLGLEWRGGLQPGETVMVLGASGAVGQIGVQAARLLGAGRVIAAARSEEGLARALEQGADATVQISEDADLAARYREAAGAGIDLVLDPIWGPAAIAAIAALADEGRLVQIGNSSGATTEVTARAIRTGQRSILGHTNFVASPEVKGAAFQAMCRHATAGELSVPVEEVPLDEVEQAWRRQAEAPHRKLVIRPG